jgi:hypothetical protein
MGLVERDGVIILIGLIGSVLAAVAVTAVTVVFIQQLPEFMAWIGKSLGF